MIWVLNYNGDRMIMKKFVFIISVVLVALWACNDEDEVSYYQVPGVSAAEDFVDSRDQKVYKCITIGDQIWLAENLAYRLTLGDNNLACRTFEEKYLSSPIDSVKLTGQDYVDAMNRDIANGVLPDATYEMFGTTIYVKDDISNYFLLYQMGVDDVIGACEMYEMYYGWPSAFREALIRYKEELPAQVVVAQMIAQGENADRENGNYSGTYGYLYSLEGALAALPEEGGWRLPTEEDWEKLERHLGMAESDVARENDWRGTTEGALLKEGEHGIGFNALFAGGKMYTPSYSKWYDANSFSREGQNAYFWTSEKIAETDSTYLGVIRSVAIFNDQILRTTTRLENEDGHPTMFSVRLVKDKN